MTVLLTHVVIDSCCKAFLPDCPTRQPKRCHWLPPRIVKHIKVRRLLQSKLHQLRIAPPMTHNDHTLITHVEGLLRLQQARVKHLLAEHKHARAGRIRQRLLQNDTRINNFWKFVKQHCKATQKLTASYNETGDVVFSQKEISDEVVRKWTQVFSGQLDPVFPDSQQPPLPNLDPSHPLLADLPLYEPTQHESYLCRPFTPTTLNAILDKLKDHKSNGIDNIPSEVLKYSCGALKEYLLAFYNKILEQGLVPESLNAIKCVLIHKSMLLLICSTTDLLPFHLAFFVQSPSDLRRTCHRSSNKKEYWVN